MDTTLFQKCLAGLIRNCLRLLDQQCSVIFSNLRRFYVHQRARCCNLNRFNCRTGWQSVRPNVVDKGTNSFWWSVHRKIGSALRVFSFVSYLLFLTNVCIGARGLFLFNQRVDSLEKCSEGTHISNNNPVDFCSRTTMEILDMILFGDSH